MDFPRVVIVNSDAFNSYTGGGITLSNLFRGWPKTMIASAHTESFDLDKTICEKYYRLGREELRFSWPASKIINRIWGWQPGKINAMLLAGKKRNAIIENRKGEFLLSVYKLISEDGLQHNAVISEQLRFWVQAFQPDIVYAQLGSLGFMRLVQSLVDFTGAKLVVHMMDDWPSVRYRRGILSGIYRRQMEKELNLVFRRAAMCMGISPTMCEHYEQRYGREFLSYSNALDTATWMRLAKNDWQIKGPIKILYSGAILAEAQLSSLVDICQAVEALNQNGIAVVFEIHSPLLFVDAHRGALDIYPNVNLMSPLDDATIARTLAEADILVLPVNFDLHTRRYVRYSNPTKLPAYMISGTSILAYGPQGVDQIDRAKMDGWGYVVCEQGVENVVGAVQVLAQDKDLRQKIGRKAQQIAQRDHDAAKVRDEFHNSLILAAQK